MVGAAAAVASALARRVTAQGDRRRPNILFVLADDVGYADLSIYGRRDIQTRVLDRLAAEGLLMTHGYSNSPSCSPTRVALITGCYHQRLPVGLPEPIRTRTLDPVGLPMGQPTLPGLLQRAGYRTSLIGKWQMGWPPEHSPLRHGYRHFFGTAAAAVEYFTHRENDPAGQGQVGLYEGDAVVEREGYMTDLLAERAVQEIRTAAAGESPFFLSLHFTAAHWPWQGPGSDRLQPRADLRHYDGGSLQIFGEMMRSMDAAIGRVLLELERSGLTNETIVVFTSDNGGERWSDTWPLRGAKRELLEGGIRVPVIVRWPARIRAGGRSEQVMASMDWLPTRLAAAGGSHHPHSPPDGLNLLNVLCGQEPPRSRKLFWRFRNPDQAAARDGDWKYLRIGPEEHLFNVTLDPRERADRKNQERARFARMKADWLAWNAEMLPYPTAAPLRSEDGRVVYENGAGRFTAGWRWG